MPLISQSKIAISAMVDLTIHQVHGYVSLVSISERQNISISKIEKIFGRLRQEKLIKSARGPGGGYLLCRDAKDIYLVEIVQIFEPCAPSFEELNASITQQLWQNLTNHMFNMLKQFSLQSLVDKELKLNPAPTAIKPYKLSRGITRKQAVKDSRTEIPNSVFALGTKNLGSKNLHGIEKSCRNTSPLLINSI